MVVYGAAPTPAGAVAWIAYSVKPSAYIGMWRFIIGSLSVATILLVATAISTVVSVRRGATALNASLSALARDLAAPVARPPVPELADLADHIASLAGALASAQADRERLGAELAQRDRLAALGRVAAGVAHEVRNPLASIKLRVDLGRMRPDTPFQLAGELASVSDEITRLDRLVADLLVVAGRRKGPRASTALGELVEQRVGLLAPWAGERGVSSRSPATPPARSTPTRWRGPSTTSCATPWRPCRPPRPGRRGGGSATTSRARGVRDSSITARAVDDGRAKERSSSPSSPPSPTAPASAWPCRGPSPRPTAAP